MLLFHTCQSIRMYSNVKPIYIPVGASEHSCSTRHRIRLAGVSLDPNPPWMARTDTQQMIYYLEPLLPLRVIDTTNVHYAFKLALGVVTKESENRDHARR
jgi:hypothetical protein